MRRAAFSLLAVALVASFARSQGNVNLNNVLAGWEKAKADLQSFAAVVKRTNIDKALGAIDEHNGYALFSRLDPKAGVQARLEVAKKNNAKVYEKIICNGNEVYEYVPANNTVRVHKLPANKQGGLMPDTFLSFVFERSAKEAKARFTLVLDEKHEQMHALHVIKIEPKSAEDKAEFTHAQIVLRRDNHAIVRIWHRAPNGNETFWDFKDVQMNVQIPAKHFQADVPADWKRVPVQPLVEKPAKGR